jgi:hypothetical protein
MLPAAKAAGIDRTFEMLPAAKAAGIDRTF